MRRECRKRFSRRRGLVLGLAKVAFLLFGIFVRGVHLVFVVALNIIPDQSCIAVTLNGLIVHMLLYPDHHQNWLDFGYGLLIFFILVAFRFSETSQICGFRHFLYNAREKWTKIRHVDVSRPSSELIRLCSWSWIISIWSHFDSVKQVELGFSENFFTAHGKKCLKLDMLMCSYHLW